MAADDMRINLNFVDHPKVKKLIRRGGYEAFYGLLRLFSVAGKMYQKGLFKDCSAEDIEDFADWHGEDGEMVRVMLDVGFLVRGLEGYEIHDWAHHQPWIFHSEVRSELAKTAARARWNAVGMQNACKEHAERNAPSPNPNPNPNPNPIEKGPTRLSPCFKKPSVEEVSDYCTERANGVDPQAFIDFYESKGWKIGKAGMTDWKAAVRTWEKRQLQMGKKPRYTSEGYNLDISKYKRLGGTL